MAKWKNFLLIIYYLLLILDSEICNKIKNELQIGHEKLCPWPNNPCPPSFLSVPSQSAQQWKADIKHAFSGLLELKGNLPELNEDAVAAMVKVYSIKIQNVANNFIYNYITLFPCFLENLR